MNDSDAGVMLAALMPHPPIVVPGVGRGREHEAGNTVAAMARMARRLCDAAPQTLVVISPHSPRRRGRFGIWGGTRVEGDLAVFRAPHERIDFPADTEFRARLTAACSGHGLRTWEIENEELDHGAVVPLAYLRDAGWNGPTVVVGLNYPDEGHLEDLGAAIAAAAEALGRRVAVLASGDMSHRLTPDAPGGYHPRARDFDATFVRLVRAADVESLCHFDEELRGIAGEDVVDVTVVALAAVGFHTDRCELLSYEGPFGVGYSVALLCDRAPVAQAPTNSRKLSLARLARRAVEDRLHGRKPAPPNPLPTAWQSPAAVFVTIRTRDGELRGCIGTLAPEFATLAEETLDRAAAAAFNDPRFNPVEANELPHLVFEVSVLHPTEPVESQDELDPARYGVVVSDDRGRRAVMLPGIETLDTVEKQLDATRRKAGIPAGAPVHIERFEVVKHTEEVPP
ncbi:MAG: AmmeMemoRadiSam system protein A [Candidatus Sumerlaeia bacterium]|nr:AmmeMemoRadiSam system protein A [Candidatus Sumerlaeia bacterium]